jgi:hypothetical protein
VGGRVPRTTSPGAGQCRPEGVTQPGSLGLGSKTSWETGLWSW